MIIHRISLGAHAGNLILRLLFFMKKILIKNKAFVFFYIITIVFVLTVSIQDDQNISDATVQGIQTTNNVLPTAVPTKKPLSPTAQIAKTDPHSFSNTNLPPAAQNNDNQQDNKNSNDIKPTDKPKHNDPTPTPQPPTSTPTPIQSGPTPTQTPEPTPTPTPEIIIIDPPYPDCPKPPNCPYPMPHEDSIQKWPICPEYPDVYCL